MNLIIRPQEEMDQIAEAADERSIFTRAGIEHKLCACGKMFTPYRPYQRFCCDAHRVKYSTGKRATYVKRPNVALKCKECGKEFITNDSKRHYCSKECYELFQSKRHAPLEERVCLVCGQSFVTSHWSKRYCSETCRKESHK